MESHSIRKSSENSLYQRKNQSDTDINLKPKGRFSYDFSSKGAFYKPKADRKYTDNLSTQPDDIQAKLDQIGRASLKPPESNLNLRRIASFTVITIFLSLILAGCALKIVSSNIRLAITLLLFSNSITPIMASSL